jgi:cytochrome oxidase assembly protein ShyY1
MTIPNNHLSYALTWFALAATLAAMTAAFIVKREQARHDTGVLKG